ncbi:MAG: PAS domain S-box protein [Bacteroidetes bacterium]|nr:MAG: PAS domain S-box protein [Bacteroidota bacterium]
MAKKPEIDIVRLSTSFFESSADGLIVTNQQGKIVYVNTKGAELFGYEVDELMGQSVEVLLPAAQMEKHQRLRENYHRNPHPRPMAKGYGLKGKRKDGSIFMAEISLNPLQLEAGQYVVAQVVDVSERKRLEAALKKEQQRFQQYLDVANIIIVVLDREQRVELINKYGSELLGYEEAELLGKNWFDLVIPEEEREKARQFFMEKMQQEEAYAQYESSLLSRTGKRHIIEWRNTYLRNEQGEVISTLSAGIDLTHHKQLLTALQESEARLKSIIETALDGIITIDEKGTVQSVNPAAERLFGYSAGEIIGHNISMLMPQPHREQHDHYIQRYLSTGHKKIIGIGREVRGLRKDGSQFPFWLSVTENRLSGRILFTGMVHDLTEQKEAESALKKHSEELEKRVKARTEALAQAISGLENEIRERKQVEKALKESRAQIQAALDRERELNELKSRFVSMASHEFRTPLATILSSINLIDKYHEPDKKERRIKHIHRIRSNVRDLTNILNDFLSLSKLEEGRVNANYETFDLPELVEEVCEDLRTQAKTGQQILYTHKGGQQQAFLDIKLLKQILHNLLSNAIKYSPEHSEIRIVSKIDDQHIRFTIADQGIGIPKSEQSQLFTRFFRAHNATNIQGTGLGLSIVKKHVKLMKGDISFTSEEGVGTTFSLSFPVQQD